MNLKDRQPAPDVEKTQSLSDRWILHRLNAVIKEETDALDEYRFNDGAQCIYQFVWHEFCDWYLEMIKPVLYGEEGQGAIHVTQSVLSFVLETILRLLHPFMPFITEEIWQRMPWTDGSIMIAAFPRVDDRFDAPRAAEEMEWVKTAVSTIRNIRGELSIAPSQFLHAIVVPNNTEGMSTLEGNRHLIETLARVSPLEITGDRPPPRRALTGVSETLEVSIPIDEAQFIEEKRRLEKEVRRIKKELAFVTKKLANQAFRDKAPGHVVRKEEAKRAEYQQMSERLAESLRRLEGTN